jgi:hypothetical protein
LKPNTEKVPTGVKTNSNVVSLGVRLTVRDFDWRAYCDDGGLAVDIRHSRRLRARSGTGGRPIKGQYRKALKPKRRDAPKHVPSSTPILEIEVARLTHEHMSEQRRHHYIPIFYLKQWSGEDGRICEFSKPHDRVKPRKPAGTAYMDGLNTVYGLSCEEEQYLEDVFYKQQMMTRRTASVMV